MGNEKFSVESISAKSLNISFEKWEQMLIIMQDEGYIKGIVTTKSLEDKYNHISEPIYPKITIKGMEYLTSNSFMAKAKDMLKMAGEIL